MNFEEILIDVQKNKKPIKTFPYTATEFLGVARRGWKVIEQVNKMLKDHEVLCEPEFGSAWFYGQIETKFQEYLKLKDFVLKLPFNNEYKSALVNMKFRDNSGIPIKD
jgi:hypothetical protein